MSAPVIALARLLVAVVLHGVVADFAVTVGTIALPAVAVTDDDVPPGWAAVQVKLPALP